MSDLLANFHFIRPAALLLLPAALALWWIWRRRSDPLRGWREQMDPDLLEALTVGRSARRGENSPWVLIVWIVAIVTVAGPTWRPEPNPFADDDTPLMILLKADVSMDTPDPAPSRMERAHLKVADLAEARKGQPLGLIAYASSAHLVLPPTRDTAIVSQMAAEISPAIMPQPGDRLDLALRKTTDILGKAGGSVLVIADSVRTDVSRLAQAWSDTGCPVQLLAIGAPDSDDLASVTEAAKALRADVQPLTIDNADISAVVATAARTPMAVSGEAGTRWQEAGYALVPVVALLVALSFRREEQGEEA